LVDKRYFASTAYISSPVYLLFLNENITTQITGPMDNQEINYTISQEGDYVVAQCLNVNVSSFGATKQEALTNLREAIELYFDED
jgi:hypothetical protein